MSLLWQAGRPFLFKIDPERAHHLAIAGLKAGFAAYGAVKDDCLKVSIGGLDFPNPLGMAAGFDKNAEVPDALLKLGFGFSEVGTITPLPQDGNPRPRLFRLVADQAVINRMGFNNEGHEAVFRRLSARHRNGIVGINIGANKTSEDRIGDYVKGIYRFYDVADYFTVNISSPNTPGLRDLQARDSLHQLLEAVQAARALHSERTQRSIPVFLKIAPDLSEEGLDDIASELLASDLDGAIVSNTTLLRAGLKDTIQAGEAGGLSGRPLFEYSTTVLAKLRQRVGPDMPLIGVGGVHNGETALEKIKAGANLVQLYSCMVYEGPKIAGQILKQMIAQCKRDGVKNIAEYRNSNVEQWANRPFVD